MGFTLSPVNLCLVSVYTRERSDSLASAPHQLIDEFDSHRSVDDDLT